MSVTGTAPVRWKAAGVSRPGTFVMISWPGLKPSARLYSVGSTATPSLLRGIESTERFTRRPVSVWRSRTVK